MSGSYPSALPCACGHPWHDGAKCASCPCREYESRDLRDPDPSYYDEPQRRRYVDAQFFPRNRKESP